MLSGQATVTVDLKTHFRDRYVPPIPGDDFKKCADDSNECMVRFNEFKPWYTIEELTLKDYVNYKTLSKVYDGLKLLMATPTATLVPTPTQNPAQKPKSRRLQKVPATPTPPQPSATPVISKYTGASYPAGEAPFEDLCSYAWTKPDYTVEINPKLTLA
jgi:hypothetical protein